MENNIQKSYKELLEKPHNNIEWWRVTVFNWIKKYPLIIKELENKSIRDRNELLEKKTENK